MTQAIPNYTAMNPAMWTLGALKTGKNGSRSIEVFTANGQKPRFQLWNRGDPYLRCPYGISAPFINNAGDDSAAVPPPPPPAAKKGASTFETGMNRSVPMELKHPAHAAFIQEIDNSLVMQLYTRQAELLGYENKDEQMPLGLLKRQFLGLLKTSKDPKYPATLRIKMNIGKGNLAARVSKLENGAMVPADSGAVSTGCSVVPIMEVGSIWISATNGLGCSAQCIQLLVTEAGSVPDTPMFSGLDFLAPMETDTGHSAPESETTSSSQPMEMA